MSLQWIAYRTVSNDAYEKKVSIPMWTTGTKCVREDFPKVSITIGIALAVIQKMDQQFVENLSVNRLHFSPVTYLITKVYSPFY